MIIDPTYNKNAESEEVKCNQTRDITVSACFGATLDRTQK